MKVNVILKQRILETIIIKKFGIIYQYTNQSIFQHVVNYTSTYILWKELESLYEQKSALNKTSLMQKLVKLQFKDNHNMANHLNDYEGVVN